MTGDPKICIAFNGGAAGDFLTLLLAQQLEYQSTIEVDKNGMVLNPPGQNFKKACQKFFIEKFNVNTFNNIKFDTVVNTHYCYREIIDLFPDCKFYYIDDSKYFSITTNTYIKKRLDPINKTLLDWLHETNSFSQIKKIRNLTNDQLQKIMINDWNKCLQGWKKLGLTPINLADILNKEKCCNIVTSIVQSTVDKEKFNQTYDRWATKNTELITQVLNTLYD